MKSVFRSKTDVNNSNVTRRVTRVKSNTLATAVRRGLAIGSAAVMLSISPMGWSQGAFGPVVELSELDGNNGFVINGIDANDQAGTSVSGLGDINGDGLDDLIIGASRAGIFLNGESYVLFGGITSGSSGAVELSGLDGSDGFLISGINGLDRSGRSVSDAGDINGDGIADLIIGAPGGDPGGNIDAGESYVLFGSGSIGSDGIVQLSDLDGSDGFVINGVDVDDYSGFSSTGSAVSSAGDINDDGVDDLIVGASRGDANGNVDSGKSYVVFGGSDVGTGGTVELSDLGGSDGFVLNGVDANDGSGYSVSGAGDINGDGVDDLVVGAENSNTYTGESYVVFGGNGVGIGGTVELSGLNGSDGFVIKGIDQFDFIGAMVSGVGDINADGLDDLAIGALGSSYVLFGAGNVGSSGSVELSDLDGSDGFVMHDELVASIVSLGSGDFNGDGLQDLILGATRPNDLAGASYVVFGVESLGSSGTVELSGLDGLNGFVINGIDPQDDSGKTVRGVGDFNGDQVDDLVIGAVRADPNGNASAGESYVVFGVKELPLCNGLLVTVDLNLGQTPGPGDDVILGTSGNDDIRGRAGNDTICGMGGDDYIHGNSGDDWIDGGDGVDNIRGGQGADTLFSGSGATVGTSSRIFGGNGDDTIFGGPDADDLRGGRGEDMISGEEGADSIIGNDDDDTLYGGPGADTLKGGGGENDQLFGEGDADSLNGGSGSNDSCDGGGQGGDTDTNCEVF